MRHDLVYALYIVNKHRRHTVTNEELYNTDFIEWYRQKYDLPTREAAERSYTIAIISDAHKDAYGFRPRDLYDYDAMSQAELDALLEELADAIRREEEWEAQVQAEYDNTHDADGTYVGPKDWQKLVPAYTPPTLASQFSSLYNLI